MEIFFEKFKGISDRKIYIEYAEYYIIIMRSVSGDNIYDRRN